MSLALRAPRVLAGALLLAVLATAPPTHPAHADRAIVCANAPAAAFDDVAPGSTHAANIDCVAAYGMTVGVGGGNYDPSGLVSRGQMASFLVNFFEVATDAAASEPSEPIVFDDIAGTTHATNIAIAAELDITVGRTATTYEPGADVTRSQMATFVRNAIEAAGGELSDGVPDAFDDDQGSVHEANIDTIAAAGVVQGVGDGAYDPSGHVTRAQMASFLANAAGLLDDQGVWMAPPLPVDGPQMELVARTGSSMDRIEVRWDEVATVTATGDEFAVLADDGTEDPVARGTSVSHAEQISTVGLDTNLQVDEVYWLEVTADVAVDQDGDTNEEHRIAFTFAVGDDTDTTGDGTTDDPVGDGTAGDGDGTTGDGGGDGTAGDGGSAPTITGVVTDPIADRLIVTFDTEVTCPGTGAGAWTFANGSIDGGDGHASGSPDDVIQTGETSLTCNLDFTTDGVGDGDFGTLSYSQPGSDTDRVHTATGQLLASVSDVDVVDGIAPTFTGAGGVAASDSLTLYFSEPVQCLSLHPEDLLVEKSDSTEQINVVDYSCSGASDAPVANLTVGSIDSNDSVDISIVGNIHDESGDNTVPAQLRSTLIF